MQRKSARFAALGNHLLRVALSLALLIWSLVACTNGTIVTNPPDDGPLFVVSSPSDGAQIAGPVYFAIQPLEPNEVSSVRFEADGSPLEVDAPGEDTFKVFVVPSDYSAGPLELRAVVTGVNGESRSETITVEVVENPPSSTTVGTSGAVLGTTEQNGAMSTLTIPPGTAIGANVSFTARTQAEVKAATGVDYGALGVTFLGAQEIQSSQPLDGPIGVSSGGFAPQVQPGQAVVNYLIAPDADGDGIGELVVINTAATAPNGDVISDPVPVLAASEVATGSAGTGGFRPLATGIDLGTITASPGSVLTFRGTGFNPGSFDGNVAVFRAGAQEVTVPGVALPDSDDPAVQTFTVVVPILAAGSATVTLTNLSSGYSAGPYPLTLTTPTTPTDPSTVIDDFFAAALAYVATLPTDGDPALAAHRDDAVSKLQEARSGFAALASSSDPTAQALLLEVATAIENSGITADLATGSLETLRLRPDQVRTLKVLAATLKFIGNVTRGFGFFPGVGLLPLVALAAGWAITLFIYADRYFNLFNPCVSGSGPGGLATFDESIPVGMGSVQPSGGSGCGGVGGLREFQQARSGGAGLEPQQVGLEPGRVVVKIFSSVGGVSLTPFTGLSDPGGYFFVPLIPEGETFTALATDTLTGDTRIFEGVGPAVGESVVIFFDFSSGGNAVPQIDYGEIVSGRVAPGETDLYRIDGQAGDVVGLIYVRNNQGGSTDGLRFILSAPDGGVVADWTGVSGRDDAGEVESPVTLPSSGGYTLSVAPRGAGVTPGDIDYRLSLVTYPGAAPLASAYTLGGEVTNPTAGPTGFAAYAFDGTAGQSVNGTIAWLADGSDFAEIDFFLIGPDGLQEAWDWSDSSYGEAVRMFDVSETLGSSGTYTLVVAGGYNGDWGYTMRLSDFPPNATAAPPLSFGVPESFTATATGYRWYSFAGVANQVPSGNVSWSYLGNQTLSCRLYVEILDLDGNLVDTDVVFNRDCAPGDSGSGPWASGDPLPADGTYTLIWYLEGTQDNGAELSVEFTLDAP